MRNRLFLFLHTISGKCLLVFSLLGAVFSFGELAAQSSRPPEELLEELRNYDDEDTTKLQVLDLLTLGYLERNIDSAAVFATQLNELAQKQENSKYMIRGLTRLGDIEFDKSNFEQAMAHFKQALHISHLRDERQDEPYLLRWMSSIARKTGEFANALDYCRRAEASAIANKDTAETADVYNNFGIIYHDLGNYSKASEYYFKSIEIWEDLNSNHGLVNPINNLGMLFIHQHEYRHALEYLQRAADIYAELDYSQSVANTILNMGIANNKLGVYDSAMEYFKSALAIFEKAGNKDRIATVYLNMGYCYLDRQVYDTALLYLEKALDIRQKTANGFGVASSFNALCECYLMMQKYEEAINYCEQAFEKAGSLNALGHIRTATGQLAEAYEAKKQYDKAYYFMKLNKAYSDSSFNEQKTRLINDLRIDYEVDKKEQEIEWLNATRELQAAELRQQKLVRNISVAAVVLLVALGIILFRIYRLNREKKELIVKARLEKEKQEAERLKELDEAKSRFFANIAHEFRTPLTLILGPSEQILEEYPDAKLKESLGLIRKNAGNLLQLTNQMLDLSKLESGMVRLRPERKDFIRFAKGCVFAFASLAEEKDIQLRCEADLKNPVIDFDPDKCSIIFNNLLSNALKFTPPFGEVVVTVKHFPGAAPSEVRIEVADSGIGIPQEQLPYIFDRFYQVDDSFTRKTQGTGIGLALTKELIELHGGKIEVSSTPGKGTCFAFTLPVHQEEVEEVILEKDTETPEKNGLDKSTEWIENQTASHSLTPASTRLGRENQLEHTVLIVEDNAEVRKFIIDVIGKFYHTLEAENGQTGFDAAYEHVPDLIISDVMMPEMDGYTFCRQIRENDSTSHIPLIMLTAKAGIDSKIEGLDRGADDYLAKPFNARELLARIKNLIELRQRLQQKYKQTNDESLFAQKENAFITKLKSIIEENLDREDFSIEDLGQALAMSRTQVHRKLKALTNQSTSQFIRRFKLSKALEMLKTRDYNVSEVAYKVGFNSATYFSTCFTEEFGYAPSELKV